MLDFRMHHGAETWRNVTARAFVTLPQLPSVALRDRASSSATPRASPLQSGGVLHPFGQNFAGVTCQESPYLSASHPHCTSWPLALSSAEFPRTLRARGFSGRGPRESIDRVSQCKLREAVPARMRARCPD